LKFFNEKVVTREHVDMIKGNLKIYVTDKITNFNNNFIEHRKMEKGVLVNDKNDVILKLVEQHLEPWLDPWEVIQMQILSNSKMEYEFKKLPIALRKYMKKMDALFYEISYNRYSKFTAVNEYDYRHERLIKLIPDFTEDEYEQYVHLGHTIPTGLAKRARDSARRSYKSIKDIFKSNVDRFSMFMTLTVADEKNKDRHLEKDRQRGEGEYSVQFEYIHGADFERVKKEFSKIMYNLSRKLKRKGIPFEYVAVWELQTNGNYHFHLLCTRIPIEELYTIPKWLDYDYIGGKSNHANGLGDWKHGKSDVQEIKDKTKISTYVSKYIMKSFKNVDELGYQEYLNKKKYFVTRGLERSTYEYLDEKNVQAMLGNLVGNLEPFVNEYVNPYNNGLITSNHYTTIK
jgi:hypothetical protein